MSSPRKIAIIDAEDAMTVKPLVLKVNENASLYQTDSTYDRISIGQHGQENNSSIDIASCVPGPREDGSNSNSITKTKNRNKKPK